jgi:ubiquinol-cytochrome c reductase subunit 7
MFAARLAQMTQVPVRTGLASQAQARPFTNTRQFKKFVFNASGFNQYGLYHDDPLTETADVKEALRRLPAHLLDERQFRLQRAIHCSMNKTVLPKEEWVTYEDNLEKGYYLQDLLQEVVKERAEREAWNKQ